MQRTEAAKLAGDFHSSADLFTPPRFAVTTPGPALFLYPQGEGCVGGHRGREVQVGSEAGVFQCSEVYSDELS